MVEGPHEGHYVGEATATGLVQRLSELLHGDAEAVAAYADAAERLSSSALRTTALNFREDHERHVDELTRLLRAFGGRPTHQLRTFADGPGQRGSTIAPLSGDPAILRALKRLERAGRDRYRSAAQEVRPPQVAAVLRRGLNDASAHYAWTLEMLDDLELGHASGEPGLAAVIRGDRLAGLVHGVGRGATAAVGRARVGVAAQVDDHPIRAALIAIGFGVWAAAIVAGRASDRGTDAA